ncbi:HK97 gp10 family phage protein [Psychrobacillus insolitus]|uniref:HK97 gp10 family phage protein n=1 Tax=Psychrobacillus insolitus TaxID=1461 RepID=A0A2W7MVR7_9BACI|nr:HK97-gp10 family putative phage morphogenesis protein [Psychrobacillus insolitus]PZX07901.1 HK97 gp10 family phage protein [Psychrobacillus insolitus]
MSRNNITFGNKQLSAAVLKWGEDVLDDAKRIIADTAYLIVNQAKALAPEDDGSLKRSIEVNFIDDGLTAVVTVGAHYAIYVEYGTGIYAENGNGRQDAWTYYSIKLGRFVTTRGMRPQPFWFPAVEAGQKYFRKEMKKLGR